MSNSLQSHGLQHTRLTCPSLYPRFCFDSCPLNHWCYPSTSSYITPFSPHQSFPASGSFPMSQLLTSGGQNIRASASTYSEYSGLISFRIDWFDLLALQGTLKSLLQYYSPKASILQCSALFMVQQSHPYMTTGKTTALTRQNFVGKAMSAFQYAV